MPFVQFWFEFLKDNRLVEFFDTLLLNLRKYKDTYKLELVAQMTNNLELREKDGMDEVKERMNELLAIVLKIFFRLS